VSEEIFKDLSNSIQFSQKEQYINILDIVDGEVTLNGFHLEK